MPEFFTSTKFFIFAGYILLMSIITFIAYGIDKEHAIYGTGRTKEKTLLGLSLAGGAIGGIIAMNFFHHKTLHDKFWAVNYFAIGLHIFIMIGICGK